MRHYFLKYTCTSDEPVFKGGNSYVFADIITHERISGNIKTFLGKHIAESAIIMERSLEKQADPWIGLV